MAENAIQRRANVLQTLMRLIQREKPDALSSPKKKPKHTEDDPWYYNNASPKVQVQYYKNLGRGPF